MTLHALTSSNHNFSRGCISMCTSFVSMCRNDLLGSQMAKLQAKFYCNNKPCSQWNTIPKESLHHTTRTNEDLLQLSNATHFSKSPDSVWVDRQLWKEVSSRFKLYFFGHKVFCLLLLIGGLIRIEKNNEKHYSGCLKSVLFCSANVHSALDNNFLVNFAKW